MRYRLWQSGKTIDLSGERKLGEGGEAQVFSVAALRLAAKIYHRPTPEHFNKLKVMLANPPADPTAGQGHVSIAWPVDLLLQLNGKFSGYVMPLVEGMQPLFRFYIPKLRRQEQPLFDYFYLVTAALNVATAVRALHDRNYVIGDVNESNILVAETALATVVDTDSFQVTDTAGGIIYRCPVFKPEFTAPELHGKDLALVNRTREHDRFGLAVLLFQLLMEGTHPFDGVYSQAGEPPPFDARIAAGHFPHSNGKRVPYRPKPIAAPFWMLDPALQQLFVQCFVDGHARPSARPDAATWRAALTSARKVLRTCANNEHHRHWGHVACPWCDRARRLRGVDSFPSVQAIKQGQHLLQRSTGAPTPPSVPQRPMPMPARTVPTARPSPVPAQPPVRIPRKAWAWGGSILALILVLIFASPNWHPTAKNSTAESSSSQAQPAPNPLGFLDSPEEGKNFRVMAGMNMVWIASGIFQMGSTNGDSDEKPVHEVRLTKGYWLGETEVIQAQWGKVRWNPSHFRADDRPVESVKWNEAVEFCAKLTELARAAGRLPEGIEYRLPTEAQWEYACRAGATGDFAGQLDMMAWYDSNSSERPNGPKMKLPNGWGLYDMHGNVGEWCANVYEGYSAESQVDPSIPSNGTDHVYRGGSWASDGWYCRSGNRDSNVPDYRNNNLGFRLAAVLSHGSEAISEVKVEQPRASGEVRSEAAVEITAGMQAGEEREFEISQNVKVTMCWIPAGKFTMGDPAWVENFNKEKQRDVRISRGFWLAKHECIQETWRAVMAGNPSHFQGETLPVEQVSWNDCQMFIGKLGRPTDGWRFDLPTEAQWEYACEARTYKRELNATAWYSDNSEHKTHPVGMKKANAWGLQDMHGNVFEWCRDANAVSGLPLPGGTNPEVKDGHYRMIRGGSWMHVAWHSRSASRDIKNPKDSSSYVGFRLALVPSDRLR